MYENITYEVILERMLERVSDKIDKREGAVIFDTLSPTAIEFQILYLELDNILKEVFGNTASREFLILRCMERGIEPYQATHTVLLGEFMPETIDVTGQRFNIGEINYVVTEQIEPGKYQVQCENAGTVGNQYLGTMIPMEYIDGLKTAELTQILIPGEDEEDTEDLRRRYFASFDSQAFGGNRKDYLEKTNAIAGVGCTKVTPVWNADISPSAMIPDAEATSWYQSVIESLDGSTAAWLTSVYTAASKKKLTIGGTVKLTILDSEFNKASDVLISRVQEEIDPENTAGEGFGLAPIGHVVNVDTVSEVSINITTELTFDTGYAWSNLQSSIDSAIRSYLLELRKTWADSTGLTVRISQIETRLLNINGIVDIQGTKINGAATNLLLSNFEIPVFGGVVHD